MDKLLLIEDDLKIARALKRFLQEHFNVIQLTLPSEVLNYLAKERVDVIVLDLSLPQMDGLDLCVKIREIVNVPVIISSARTGIEDKLFALKNGAEDYLPKPYDPRELLARLNILVGRKDKKKTQASYFQLDKECHVVTYKDERIELTQSEFEIFNLLFSNTNKTIARVDIANSLSKHKLDSGVESINVLIGRIRKKLEPNIKDPIYIQTVRGVGYRFSDEFAHC